MSDELIGRAQAGDADAFAELLRPRLNRLYQTASLILHDRMLGEDAVQEGLIRAWRSLPSLRQRERFDAWLRRIVVHACIDTARGAQRSRREQALPVEVLAPGDIEREVAARDAVTRAFGHLKPDQRAAFVLRHFLGHSVPEVADALGIPLGTAKSRLHYAERTMAAAIDTDATLASEGGFA